MTQSLSRCLFTEGSIELPAGFFDHTVNVLRSTDPAAPAYTIGRDRLLQGVTLSDYINSQLAIMEKHLPGWRLWRNICLAGRRRSAAVSRWVRD